MLQFRQTKRYQTQQALRGHVAKTFRTFVISSVYCDLQHKLYLQHRIKSVKKGKPSDNPHDCVATHTYIGNLHICASHALKIGI